MTPTVTLVGDAQLLVRFGRIVPNLRTQIRVGLERFGIFLQTWVVTNKLSGNPLKRRTGALAESVNVAPVTETAEGLWSSTGTNKSYAGVHEFGGTFLIPGHVRTISQIFGQPITPREVFVRQHSATYPERSFLRSSLDETKDKLLEEMEAAKDRAVKE